MGLANDSVAQNFASRKINKRAGDCAWSGSNFYCAGNALYSYGRHFIVAVYLGTDAQGNRVFLKNGDRHSSSTGRHQSLTDRVCNGPTASFSALRAAGFRPESMTTDDVVDWRTAQHLDCYRDVATGQYFRNRDCTEPFKTPSQGMMMGGHYESRPGVRAHYWHILGACLLRRTADDNTRYQATGQNGLYLCAMDEGRYFVSHLPDRADVTTTHEAFNALKPDEVKAAESRGDVVVRQGEWFFVRTALDSRRLAGMVGSGMSKTRFMKELARVDALPRGTDGSGRERGNRHCVRQATVNGATYCTGRVYHRNAWGNDLTREHATLRLGENWYTAHRNTERASWSVGGKFD